MLVTKHAEIYHQTICLNFENIKNKPLYGQTYYHLMAHAVSRLIFHKLTFEQYLPILLLVKLKTHEIFYIWTILMLCVSH